MSDIGHVFESATSLTGHSNDDWATLASVSHVTTKWGPAVVKVFYDTLYGYPPTAKVLASYSREEREAELIAWYENIVSGNPGESFWQDQWVVGLIHVVVKVDNAFMLGIGTRVELVFFDHCFKELEPELAARVYSAFKRIVSTATIMVAEAYLSGLLRGMAQVGVNDQLMTRMRSIAVKKMIREHKGSKWEPGKA